jgi:outer membrane protein OmpA-like peptidoglycan-associated protein
MSHFQIRLTSRGAAALVLASVVLAPGCSWNRTAQGGTIGAGAGGVIGGIIGKQSGNTAAGAIIGAVIGGSAGAAIGRYMDRQAAEIQQDLKNARVERVGEGIKITFDTGILFDVDRAELRPQAQQNLAELSGTLQKYKDTEILVQGHTDDTGSSEHNQMLSESRANSVARELKTHGVVGGRINTEGMGETQPVADNKTEAGRQANRRVEVAIYANDKLKKAAKEGKI